MGTLGFAGLNTFHGQSIPIVQRQYIKTNIIKSQIKAANKLERIVN